MQLPGFLDERRLLYGPWKAFERDVARLLVVNGFDDVRVVGGSGDRGADVLGVKNGVLWVWQCKHTTSSSPPKAAVSEVVEAARYYGADRMVVATSRRPGRGLLEEKARFERQGLKIDLVTPAVLLRQMKSSREYAPSRRALRDYQEKASSRFREALLDTGRAQVVLATGLGKTVGARPIVIGLTVVSLGTSAPELVVCVLAAVGGSSDLAIGNALGSNLANIGLILGVTAIVQPLGVNRRMVVREIPAMLLITLLVYPLIMDHDVSRPDGAILLMVLVFYLGALLKSARRETPAMLKEFEAHSDEIEAMPKSLAKNILLVLLGSALLVLGGRIIVVSAIHIATGLGISELLIGGTVVAIGTSLPELATTVVAATRNEADIAVGNVIGSNIFNLTAVLGAAAVVEPLSIASGVLDREFLAVVVLSVLVWPVAWTGLKVRRWEGLLLLMVYAVLWLWLGQS